MLTLGVGHVWAATQSFTVSDIDASHTSATKNPITVSIGGAVTVSSPQFRFSAPMTVSASGVYKISGISVTTNSTEAYISPLGNTVSSGTWSRVSATNYTWSGDTKSVTLTPNSGVRITNVTVTYYEVTDKYTVTFNRGSGTCATSSLTESTACGGVELPSATPPSDCVAQGWVFAGWKRTSAQTETTIAPTLYTAGSQYYLDADETLYAVYSVSEERTGCSVGKIASDAGFAVGDRVILYYETGKMQFDGISGDIGSKTSYSTAPAETHVLEVREGNASGQVAFYDLTSEAYLSLTSNGNYLNQQGAVDAYSSWTVSISSGDAAITNANYTTRSIRYNSGSPRFCCYEGTQQAVQLYKLCPPVVTYNSNPDCTVDHFIDIMHDNVIADQTGTYAMPEVSDASKGDDTYCDEKHYHFMGWVESIYIKEDGTLDTGAVGYALYPAGHAGHMAANKTFYAIWAKE